MAPPDAGTHLQQVATGLTGTQLANKHGQLGQSGYKLTVLTVDRVA